MRIPFNIVDDTAKKAVDEISGGLGDFLEDLFKPGLQELGFMIQDKVRVWRLKNIIHVMDNARGRFTFVDNKLQLQANSRVGLSIFEECSKVDDEELQNLWAGLFASSCTKDGRDDSNLIFVDLLKRISVVEARILKYACENSPKTLYPNDLIVSEELIVTIEELMHIAQIDDIQRLDRELDHMSSLSLINHGSIFGAGIILEGEEKIAHRALITPTALGLNLYYKTNSINVTAPEFWKDTLSIYRPGMEHKDSMAELLATEIDKISPKTIEDPLLKITNELKEIIG